MNTKIKISKPTRKPKPTRGFKALVIFDILTATVSGGICKLTSLQIGNLWIGTSKSSPVICWLTSETIKRIRLQVGPVSLKHDGTAYTDGTSGLGIDGTAYKDGTALQLFVGQKGQPAMFLISHSYLVILTLIVITFSAHSN